MNDTKGESPAKDLVLDYDLDAPPEKVWRAISIPAFRETWLPKGDLADMVPVSTAPGEEIRYRMQDGEPPFLESVVTFQIEPNAAGGTRLRIIHGLAHPGLGRRPPRAANNNWSCRLRAA